MILFISIVMIVIIYNNINCETILSLSPEIEQIERKSDKILKF